MKLTETIKHLVTQIIARDVAAGVELARTLGFQMPKDFTIGVRFLDWHSGNTCVQIRLDDATHKSIVQLPDLNGQQSLKITDAMWQVAWQRLHADALTVAQVWLYKHPEAGTGKEGATKALSFLDALEDEGVKKWMDACRERAKSFKYTTAGGPRDW